MDSSVLEPVNAASTLDAPRRVNPKDNIRDTSRAGYNVAYPLGRLKQDCSKAWHLNESATKPSKRWLNVFVMKIWSKARGA
jgi:hypothetical protein